MKNLKVIWALILSDKDVYPFKIGTGILLIINVLFCRYPTFAYMFWFRLASRPNPFYIFAKFMHIRLSRKYSIQIPPKTKIGRGFLIWHGCGIVINPDTIIGDNCTIYQFLSIGASHRGAAHIGNNVWIGPHVSIVEDVHIGNNVKIGAGTVVIKDIPDGCVSVGNPNRIIYK